MLEAYNPATDSWTTGLASLSHLSGCAIAGAISGKMYLFTPCNGYSGYASLLDVYDPVANSWTSLPNSPTSHAAGAGGVINGKLYIVGGVNTAGAASGELDVYDPATGVWSTLAPMPAALINLQGASLNGKLYVTGGSDITGTVISTDTYVYDPVANSWSTQTPLPAPLQGAVAIGVNGLLYVAGGNGNPTYLNTLQILSPSVCTIAGSTVTITSVGTCTVAADQPGNINYSAAPEVAYAITVLPAQTSCSAIPALTITYYTIGESDRDIASHPTGVSTNFVLPALGTNGLPVFNPNTTANSGSTFTPNDLLSDGEITWWSPTLNNGGPGGGSDVVETDAGPVSLPFSNNNFYPPNGGGANDLNGLQAAVLSGTLYAPAAETISFSIASDDVAFAYLDGQLACDDGGLHLATAVPCTTATVSPGNHTLKLFYADLNPVDAALDFSVITSNVCVSPVLTTPTISWPVPAAITYGTPLSATQLNATASYNNVTVQGTFNYNPVANTVLLAGPQTLSVTFIPTDSVTYATAQASVPLTVNPASSVTTVLCPASVTYNGTGQTPCSASVTGAGGLSVNLTSSLTYGSNVNAGVNTAFASATYAGDANHTSSTQTVTFSIAPAPVTAQAGVGTAVYDGNAHSPSACQVTGTYIGDLSCTDSPATVGPDVVYTTIVPVVAGSNLSNFAVNYQNGSYTISPAPSVTTVTCPASVPYTGAAQTPCTASVTGVGGLSKSVPVSYTSNISAGVNTATASATYAGDTDHSSSSNSKTFTITQATPVVTWANPPSIVYGTPTGPAQKTATATGVGGVSLQGSYYYTTPDGTVFGVGTHPLGVAFTPTDSTDYMSVSAYAYLTVTKATPTVNWAAPAAITYGTALSSVQLNATSPVPGTFVYTPAAGSVLHAGSQTLSVTFTPNDTTDYNTVTTTVPLTVNKATPVITWPTPASITYGTPLSATQLDATANVAGTFLYTALTGPNPLGVLLPPGTTALSATLTPTDSTDYNPVTAYVVFTVSKAQTTTTLAVSTTQTVTGTTATLTATVKPQIGGTPTGTVTYYNGSTVLGSAAVGTAFTTAVLPVGTDQITAVYGGDANFVGSSSSASAVVSVAPTTVQLTSPLSRVFYPGSAVSFTVIVPLKNLQLISGTITLYDGATVIGTYSLPAGGILDGITPQLSVGTHTLRAVYGGNAQYPPGQSPVVTVTVAAL